MVDLQLPVGQATETINVSAEVSTVETSTAALSSLVNQTQMRELPLNGRNFEQLILLAPGVSTHPAGGSSALTSVANAYSIAGTRPEGYANMLDGEDMLNWWQRNAGGEVLDTTYVNFVPSATVHQGIISGTPTPIHPASAAMLALYPLPTKSILGNADVGQYNFVGPQTSPEDFGLVRVDYNISDKDALFGRYQIDFGSRTTFGGLSLWPTFDVTHN